MGPGFAFSLLNCRWQLLRGLVAVHCTAITSQATGQHYRDLGLCYQEAVVYGGSSRVRQTWHESMLCFLLAAWL